MYSNPAFSAKNMSRALALSFTLQKKRSVGVYTQKAVEISPPDTGSTFLIELPKTWPICDLKFEDSIDSSNMESTGQNPVRFFAFGIQKEIGMV